MCVGNEIWTGYELNKVKLNSVIGSTKTIVGILI